MNETTLESIMQCSKDEDNTVSCAHCKVQRLYELTEPKE